MVILSADSAMGQKRKQKAAKKPPVDIEAALKEQRERHLQAAQAPQAASSSTSSSSSLVEARNADAVVGVREIPGFVYDAESQRYYRASGLRNPFSVIPVQHAAESGARAQRTQSSHAFAAVVENKLNLVERLRQRECSMTGRFRGDLMPNVLARSQGQMLAIGDAEDVADVDYCPELNMYILAMQTKHVGVIHQQVGDTVAARSVCLATRLNNSVFRTRSCIVEDRLLIASCGSHMSIALASVDDVLGSAATGHVDCRLAHVGPRHLYHSAMDVVRLNGRLHAIASTLEGGGRFLTIDMESGRNRIIPGQWQQQEEPTCLHEFADNQILCGMRNGGIRLLDLRSNDVLMMGALPIRCNHGQAIGNSQFVLFQDMIGNLRMYDIRKPRAYVCEYVRAYQKESALRQRRFLVDEQERYVGVCRDGGEFQAINIRTQRVVNGVRLTDGADVMLPGNPVSTVSVASTCHAMSPSPWGSVPVGGLEQRSGILHFCSV